MGALSLLAAYVFQYTSAQYINKSNASTDRVMFGVKKDSLGLNVATMNFACGDSLVEMPGKLSMEKRTLGTLLEKCRRWICPFLITLPLIGEILIIQINTYIIDPKSPRFWGFGMAEKKKKKEKEIEENRIGV
ncbi:hypothetical protein Tco_1305992 [Tanacetum coccineum]